MIGEPGDAVLLGLLLQDTKPLTLANSLTYFLLAVVLPWVSTFKEHWHSYLHTSHLCRNFQHYVLKQEYPSFHSNFNPI